MSERAGSFTVHIHHVGGYVFRTSFDKEQFADLLVDEPPPLGTDSAPNPARILAAALGNCLAASLQFCLRKAGIEPLGMSATAQVQLVRNDERRLRIGEVNVTLFPEVAEPEAVAECVSVFEDFCVVTESVRQGLDVRVHVEARTAEQRTEVAAS